MDFLTYALSLNPVILNLPVMGHLTNYDTYGRTVTIGGSPRWARKTKQGHYIESNGGGRITIAHAAEQFSTDRTVILFSPDGFAVPTASQTLASKYDGSGLGGNCSWAIVMSAGKVIIFYGTGFSFVNHGVQDYTGKKSAAFIMEGSSDTYIYYDGVLQSSAGGDVYSDLAQNVSYMAEESGSFPNDNTYAGFALFPTKLTNEQIGLLHQYFLEIIYGYEPKTKLYIPRIDTKGAVIDLWGDPGSGNVIADRSGNGNDGTITENMTFVSAGETKYTENFITGNGRIELASDASYQDLSNHTWEVAIEPKSLGESGFGRIVALGTSGGSAKQILLMNGENWAYRVQYADGLELWSGPSVATNYRQLIQLTHNVADVNSLPRMWINGQEETMTKLGVKSGALTSTSGDVWYVGNRQQLNLAADTKFEQFKVYPSILSDDNLRDEYLKYALGHVKRHTPRFEYPITLGVVSAPNKVGPWDTWFDSHEYRDDGTDRYLYHTAAGAFSGVASMPNSHDYGAWYFKFNFTDSANFRGYPLLLVERPELRASDTGQYGYALYMNYRFGKRIYLYRVDNGAQVEIDNTGIWFSTAAQTVEGFLVRRLTDSQFTFYLRDAAHSTWTQALQGTDNTYTGLNYMNNYSFDSNGTGYEMNVRKILSWPYGDSLLPNDIDEIKDKT